MSEDRKTLFESAPTKFVVPGKSKNGTAPLADLVFERDSTVVGLYRAKIDRSDVKPGNENGFKFKKVDSD